MPTQVKAKVKWRRAVYEPRHFRRFHHAATSFQAPVESVEDSGENVDMAEDGGRGGTVPDAPDDIDVSLESDSSADFIFPTSNETLGAQRDRAHVPDLHTAPPPIQDLLKSQTSVQQDYTVQECLPFLAGLEGCGRSLFDYNEHGIPRLERDKHIRYLHESFRQLPSGFVAYDASRPWLLYWALTGLSLLGENIEQYRQRYTRCGLDQ